MKSRIDVHIVAYSALLMAIGVVLPLFFHMFGIAGRIFLPMHIPVYIAGMLLGPVSGLMVGVLTPLASTLLTGLPPLAYSALMVPELATYGLMAGILYRWLKLNIWLTVITTMIAGRIVFGLVAVLIAPILGVQGRTTTLVLSAVATGWPGVIIQLIFLPIIVSKLQGDTTNK